MLGRTVCRHYLRFTKNPEDNSGTLRKWIEGLLGSDDTDTEKKSSSDSDDEDGEGGLMIPIPKGVEGLCYSRQKEARPFHD